MAIPILGLTTQINLIAFTVSGPTIGFVTSPTPVRYLLPTNPIAPLVTAQLRVVNDSDATQYIEFGDDTVIAVAWSNEAEPPAECSFIIPPHSVTYLTIPKGAGEYVSVVTYAGAGGIYFTPGAGVWSG